MPSLAETDTTEGNAKATDGEAETKTRGADDNRNKARVNTEAEEGKAQRRRGGREAGRHPAVGMILTPFSDA